MEERIVQFIRALRASKVRVGLSESIDAFDAVNYLGVKDREAFRLSLRATLIKDAAKLAIFDELFSLFFGQYTPLPTSNLTKELFPEEMEMLTQALNQLPEHLRKILKNLILGELFDSSELAQLSQFLNPKHSQNYLLRTESMRYSKQEKISQALLNAVHQLTELLLQMGMDFEKVEIIRQKLLRNQKALNQQLQQYINQHLVENLINEKTEENLDELMNRPIRSLSEQELEQLRKEVRRLANVLRTRIALRLKPAKSGSVDLKAIIRVNLKYGNIPFDVRYKNHALKPRLVLLCDLSTSVRVYSELMLSLLYEMQDQISKTYAFAFIDHLEYITPEFIGKGARQAISSVLQKMPPGHYNTDLGLSLKKLLQDYLDLLNRHTSFVIIGDGRNNYNNPRLDLMHEISRRCHRIIWFNPEPPLLWGKGDSDMLKYTPFCDKIFHVSTVSELASAIDQLLLT